MQLDQEVRVRARRSCFAPRRTARWTANGTLIWAALIALAAWSDASAQFSISQNPALVASPPPPNIVMTVDDSGSMTFAYVPDLVGLKDANGNYLYASNAGFESSSYNALYYNPALVYPVPPDATGQPVPVSQGYALSTFTHAYVDGFNPDQGWVDLSQAYQATVSYSPGAGTNQVLITGPTPGAYYYNYVGGPACTTPVSTQAPPPDSCFAPVTSLQASGPGGTNEMQNFANWYSFYRTRHLSIISAAARAMQDPSLASARIAWQGLNSCADFTGLNCVGWRGGSFDNRIRRFSDTHKTDFFNWIFQIPAGNSTPTRLAWSRAGQYFSDPTLGPNGPYGVDPNQTPTVPGNELLCVNNFNITLTDGLWNTFNEPPNQRAFCGGTMCGGIDIAPRTFPDGTAYTPATGPASTTIYGYAPGGGDSNVTSGGLSDIAFYYWSTNLRPDLTGFYVTPYFPDTTTNNLASGAANDPTWPYWNSNNDPATWPHMVNFTVGVGLTGFLSLPGLQWSGDAHDPTPGSAYRNLLSGTPNCVAPTNCTWPVIDPAASGSGYTGPSANAGNGNVYDLWHAAINSRGNAFSAESPQDIVNAMGAIISRIEGQTRGNSAAAGSSSSLTATTDLFVASYSGTDWHGTVTAYGINTSTGAVNSTPVWQTTAASIAPFASRAVFTAASGLPAGGTPITAAPGIAFNLTNLANSGQASFLGATGAAQASVLNYLLGDASNEKRNGGVYRNRTNTVLGDIVDSNPVYSYAENYGYEVLPEGQGANGYANFLAFKAAAGRSAMVYAGANDGMLHGFNAATGNEMFAYVPHSVIPNMPALDNPNYLHTFYVDGPVYVGDAYFGSNGSAAAWHSVLLGTTGAGGPGVFALDVTSPDSFGAANVLWDLDATPAPYGNADVNLGYTIGQPVIARLNNGDWAAVFGNGYLSTRGCAVLYIVRLSDGLLRTIDTSGARAGATAPCLDSAGANAANGLGTPTLVDLDQNGTTDYVYAGDLQGHLWKFDLTSGNTQQWGVAYKAGATPLPLFTATTSTGVPQPIVTAPNVGPSAGNINGYFLYFVTGHMFAVGDASDTTTQSVYAIQDQGEPITATLRSTLVQQTIIPANDGSGNENIKSPYPTVNLAASDGWYIDLPGTGERALNEPILALGTLLFSTVIPNSQPCSGGCGGFVYAVNALNGDGGQNYLIDSANNTAYDGLQPQVGCIKGLTLITKAGTLNIYVAGNGPSSGNGTGTGGNGGTGAGGQGGGGTGINNGIVPPTQLPAITPTIPGRVSWHAVIQ